MRSALVVHGGSVVDEVSAKDLNEDILNDRVYAKEVLAYNAIGRIRFSI